MQIPPIEQTLEKEKPRRPYKFLPKPEFEERMNKVLELSHSDENDKKAFWEIVHQEPQNFIRCNTLKIKPEDLKLRLEKNGWKILQPYSKYPEIMIINNNLLPGELGRSKEHLLGYYYVQELSSMLPIRALSPQEQESFVDICASPGSKTTQAAALMNNKGSIIANDNSFGRLVILASNLEKCGVSNSILTKRDAVQLAKKLKKLDFLVDKILVDVPCSGEGTIRSSPKTLIMWNLKMIENLASQQKAIAASSFELLKVGGEMLYSTCTHAPEENEQIIQFLLDNYDLEIEDIKEKLPVKSRPGLKEWNNKVFSPEIKKCARIYPQDNNTEGFFLCKIKKLSDKKLNTL